MINKILERKFVIAPLYLRKLILCANIRNYMVTHIIMSLLLLVMMVLKAICIILSNCRLYATWHWLHVVAKSGVGLYHLVHFCYIGRDMALFNFFNIYVSTIAYAGGIHTRCVCIVCAIISYDDIEMFIFLGKFKIKSLIPFE